MNRLTLTTLAFVTLPCWAKDCGVVNATDRLPTGQYAVRLAQHNGKQLMPANITASMADAFAQSRFMTMALAPGWHKLRGYVACVAPFGLSEGASNRSYCGDRQVGGSVQDSVDFYIHIEPNKVYRLAAKRQQPRSLIPGKRFEVIVESISSTHCDEDNPRNSLTKLPLVTTDKLLMTVPAPADKK